MKIEDISYGLRVASEVARTGERLMNAFAASHRARIWPLMLGVGVGVAIGVVMSNPVLRARVKTWFGERNVTRVETPKPTAPAERPS